MSIYHVMAVLLKVAQASKCPLRHLNKAKKEEPKAAKNAIPDLGTELVEILVGQNATRFMVHKELLCGFSEYFKRAFAPPFRESEEGSIRVDASEETFNVFQQWLYAQLSRPVHGNDPLLRAEMEVQDLDTPEDGEDVEDEDDQNQSGTALDDVEFEEDEVVDEMSPSIDDTDSSLSTSQNGKWSAEDLAEFAAYDDMFLNLLDLFAFADLYETRQLRNDVVSALFAYDEIHGTTPRLVVVPRMYDLLPESSTFLQYCFKRIVLEWNPYDDHPDYEGTIYQQLLRSFLFEMMMLNTRRLRLTTSGAKEVDRELQTEVTVRCNFHEHADKDERMRCISQDGEDTHLLRHLLKVCGASGK